MAEDNAFKWIIRDGLSPETVFYQGMWCSQTQLAKYTGHKGFMSTVGDKVVCKSGIEIVHKPFVGKEIDEIVLRNRKDTSYCSVAPIIHYCTNLRYNYGYGITVETSEEQEKTVDAHQIAVFWSNFGQEGDILCHHQKYSLCMKKNGNSDVILFGCSRGAATTWNALCEHKYENVKLVILEGIFYSIADILERNLPCGSHNLVHAAMPYLFPNYDVNGPAPGKCVDDFPRDIPVVIISSKVDRVVPYASTKKLAIALAKRKRNAVYFVELKKSSHPMYPLNNSADKEVYANTLHAIYKQLGLPYIENFAVRGEAAARAALL